MAKNLAPRGNDARTLSVTETESVAKEIRDATERPAFSIRIDETRKPRLVDSKLGGVPYWPVGREDYPTREDGQKLMLPAQIDLTDLDGDDRLPPQGLLQFFIDGTDNLSGLDFDSPTTQDGFRVIWHEEVDRFVTEEDVLALDIPISTSDGKQLPGNPLNGEYALTITGTPQCMTTSDGQFAGEFARAYETVMGKPMPEAASWWNAIHGSDEATDRFYEILGSPAPHHTMLGYPFFTQFDPREDIDGGWEHYDTLLFQIDSDGASDERYDRVLWGDAGICNFFVNGQAARRGDFSDVLFNWDCY